MARSVNTRGRAHRSNLSVVYERLCALLTRHGEKLSVAVKKPGRLWMEVTGAVYRGKPLYYAGVSMGKNYVSYHLMSVYMQEHAISAELRTRMQGKACFNFKTVDEKLFAELDHLTADGLDKFSPESIERLAKSGNNSQGAEAVRL